MVWGLPSSSSVVMTVTPVANSERAALNSFLSNEVIHTPSHDPRGARPLGASREKRQWAG